MHFIASDFKVVVLEEVSKAENNDPFIKVLAAFQSDEEKNQVI